MPFNFQISGAQCFKRSPAQARNIPAGMISIFNIVTARFPLWGYGTFNSTNLTTYINANGITDAGLASLFLTVGTYTNQVWPAVYNTCTESWSEVQQYYIGGILQSSGTATQTITTQFSQYFDQTQPNAPVQVGPTGGAEPNGTPDINGTFEGGTVNSITITGSLITITYSGTNGTAFGPGRDLVYVGTYTAQLSGSILNPTGTGPFTPSDGTYGWAALTAACNSLLASVAIPTPLDYTATVVVPIAASPGYNSFTGDAFVYSPSNFIFEWIFAAANGFPMTPQNIGPDSGGWGGSYAQSNVQHFPTTIADTPSPATGTDNTNTGSCMCSKSTWELNGASWVNSADWASPPARWTVPHTTIYEQSFSISNFALPGSVGVASTFSDPIAYPQTITFQPSDVAANVSTTYGMLGFQSSAA